MINELKVEIEYNYDDDDGLKTRRLTIQPPLHNTSDESLKTIGNIDKKITSIENLIKKLQEEIDELCTENSNNTIINEPEHCYDIEMTISEINVETNSMEEDDALEEDKLQVMINDLKTEIANKLEELRNASCEYSLNNSNEKLE